MSYCRFSTNCFNCDVYVYEAENGIVIHVASYRYVSDVPRPIYPKEDNKDYSNLIKYVQDSMSWVSNASLVKINLPFDGQSYSFDTYGEAAQKLTELRDAGYIVPEYVIKNLFEEEEENKNES